MKSQLLMRALGRANTQPLMVGSAAALIWSLSGRQAQAQAELAQITSYDLLADGSIDATLSDGRVVNLAEGTFEIANNQLVVLEQTAAQLGIAPVSSVAAATTGATAAVIGGTAAAMGGAAAVLSNGSDDNGSDDNGSDDDGADDDGADDNGSDETGSDDSGSVDNSAPTLTSTASTRAIETQTNAHTVTATDEDGDSLTYGISGVADADLFTIDADSGEISFISAPDYEAPDDEGADNSYEIEVSVSDGTETVTQTVSIVVNNLLEGDVDPSTFSDTAGFTLTGAEAGDYAGGSVSSAGDINGDGYEDFIIGAQGVNANAGAAYVIYGGASLDDIDLGALDPDTGFTLTGVAGLNFTGGSVSSAGDVNGDGYEDLIIGASGVDSATGSAYVIYGGASLDDIDLGSLDADTGFTLTGVASGDRAGGSVSSAGDINGDGYDDLIINAGGVDSYTGAAYVIYGGASSTDALDAVSETGTSAADNFTGNAGDDSFAAISTDDVVRGGAGDDTIALDSLDFADIDGGNGTDTLDLSGSGLDLDITSARTDVSSFEIIDLGGSGANSLTIDALSLLDLSGETSDGVTTFTVLGDSDDSVTLDGAYDFTSDGTRDVDGVTFDVYVTTNNAEILIDQDVAVTNWSGIS